MADTPEALASLLVRGIPDAERPVLRAFLADIVETASADALVAVWNAVLTDWRATDGDAVRHLSVLIRDKLGQGRTRPGWRPLGEGRTHGRRVRGPTRPKPS